MVAVDQESGVAITGHLRHTVSEPRNTNPEIDIIRGRSSGGQERSTGRPGSEARPTLFWSIAEPSPAMEDIGSEMPGSQSLATVADGSASRMVPDGKSPKVTGGAGLRIGSKGFTGEGRIQSGNEKRYRLHANFYSETPSSIFWKWTLTNRKDKSPLTQGLNYRSACDQKSNVSLAKLPIAYNFNYEKYRQWLNNCIIESSVLLKTAATKPMP